MKRKFLYILFAICCITFSCGGATENTQKNETNTEDGTGNDTGEGEDDLSSDTSPEVDEPAELLVAGTCANNSDGLKDGGWYDITLTFSTEKYESIIVKNMKSGKWTFDNEFLATISFDDFNISLKKGFKQEFSTLVYVPVIKDTEEEKKDSITLSATFVITTGMGNVDVPLEVKFPIAKLDSELVCVEGDNISIDIQKNNWDYVSDKDKVVGYMDAVYSSMYDLTNVIPFPGQKIVYQEWPTHPYWAYVMGDNVVRLNTDYVTNSIKKLNNDQLSFGWTHETGHSFDDEYGSRYNEGTYTEMQANIKLSYVVEHICTESDKLRMVNQNNNAVQTGKDYNDDYFLPFGEEYISSGRAYTTMASDEYHAFYLEVIRDTSWDTMKKFYRIYQQMEENSVTRPTSTDMIELTFSVLEYCSGLDLSDKFDAWRITISSSRRAELLEKYDVEECAAKIKL